MSTREDIDEVAEHMGRIGSMAIEIGPQTTATIAEELAARRLSTPEGFLVMYVVYAMGAELTRRACLQNGVPQEVLDLFLKAAPAMAGQDPENLVPPNPKQKPA